MFAKDLEDRLTAHGPLSGPPPQQWEQFKTPVTLSAKLTIGPKKKVYQDWFDENDEHIKELLDDKKKAFIEWQNDISSISKHDHFKHLQRQAQTALRKTQDEWWEKKANEIETYAATKNSKNVLQRHQGSLFLSVIGKILARAILNCLITNITEENLPEAQCGFRPNRNTTDMIFSVRRVQEKCIEQNMDLVAVFIDLTKACGTVNREALWTILSKLGCPTMFVNLIREFPRRHDRTGTFRR